MIIAEWKLRYGGPTGNGGMMKVVHGYLGQNCKRLLVKNGILFKRRSRSSQKMSRNQASASSSSSAGRINGYAISSGSISINASTSPSSPPASAGAISSVSSTSSISSTSSANSDTGISNGDALLWAQSP